MYKFGFVKDAIDIMVYVLNVQSAYFGLWLIQVWDGLRFGMFWNGFKCQKGDFAVMFGLCDAYNYVCGA